ncbi:MAG: hypothetical protein K2K54_02410, partial [Lachnospiraceae bacterium]|nr:hypothetical protein [Lachnospiraceae bacterium]
YDEEKHMKSERETAYQKGIECGREQGIKQGVEQGIEQGIQALIGMSAEFGGSKRETVERLMKKLQISKEKAEENVEKYWH